MTSASRFTIRFWYMACCVSLVSSTRRVKSGQLVYSTDFCVVLRVLRTVCHVSRMRIQRGIARQATSTMSLLSRRVTLVCWHLVPAQYRTATPTFTPAPAPTPCLALTRSRNTPSAAAHQRGSRSQRKRKRRAQRQRQG